MSNKSNIPYGPSQKPWAEQTPKGAEVTGPIENPLGVYEETPPPGIEGDFPKIDYKKFEIPPTGLTKRQYMDAMAELERFIKTQHINFTGFQVNENLDFQSLSWLLDIHTNNVGDPFTGGILTLNSKFCERAVMDYFAALWQADWPHNKNLSGQYQNRYWGYVLTMGSTEGNLYALYNARNYLAGGILMEDPETENKKAALLKRRKHVPEKKFVMLDPLDTEENKYTPIAFFSEDTHYSVIKSVSIVGLTTFSQEGNKKYSGQGPLNKDGIWPDDSKWPDEIHDSGKWPDEVPSHDINDGDPKSGTINVDKLKKLVRFFLERGYPILTVCNMGSTWKGAYDDVPAVNEMLEELGKEYPDLWERSVEYQTPDGKTFHDKRRRFWVHVDGALGGAYLPFLKMAKNRNEIEEPVPEFDFSIEAVMSICCSMHKWIGGPWPGGVFMTRKKYQLQPPETAGYIGSPDTTVGGSRNAFSPILLWVYFARMSYEDNMKKAIYTEKVAARLREKLQKLEDELKEQDPTVDLWLHRSPLSLSVSFRMVEPNITYKYTVDSERMTTPYEDQSDKKMYSEERTYAHIYAMESLGKFEIVDRFIKELRDYCKEHGWRKAFPETVDGKPNPGPRTPIE
ncbi:MAG: pyridoxal-dependent decarboxylase [Thermodesulfobacteriota bacterium]|nr:pyridoxal-dependent decarboxylase [Thermodesulfobacteriota bacterium]